jgi:hypothetical protein
MYLGYSALPRGVQLAIFMERIREKKEPNRPVAGSKFSELTLEMPLLAPVPVSRVFYLFAIC